MGAYNNAPIILYENQNISFTHFRKSFKPRTRNQKTRAALRWISHRCYGQSFCPKFNVGAHVCERHCTQNKKNRFGTFDDRRC